MCSVTALLNGLATTTIVAIVTDATAIVDGVGALFIAVFGKVIDFTNKMDKGLINPNQYRSFGVQCVDDPTDITRKLGFYANNMFLPLCIQGTNFITDYFYPSENELRQFPWVFMSDETSWYLLIATYTTISDMSQTMKEEADPVGSRSNNNLSISNEAIETGMDVSNLHARTVKSVKINQ